MAAFAVAVSIAECGTPATPAGPAAPRAPESTSVIQLGTKFKLTSKVLSEERPYWVHLPETYKGGKTSSISYPVLYVLDGDSHFQSAVAIVDFLTRFAMIPEMIVVAVPSTDRVRDLTPTRGTKVHGKEEPRLAHSGGGEAFERFLETELLPKIDSMYATMPYRVLVGHSLGALLSLHAALQPSSPFQAVIAMDPSLWWDDQLVVKQGAAALLSKPDPGLKSIYMSTGALPLDNGEDASEGRAAIKAFASVLARSASSKFRTRTQIFEQDNHQSVAFRSLYDGLLFTFEGYKLSTSAALEDPSRIDAHFKELSARFGVEWRPAQRVIDLVAFSLLFEQNKVEEAIRLLERNTKVYPDSSAAHYHLGRAYLVKGDKVAALRCYERALELDPSDDDLRAELAFLKKE